MQFLRKLWQGNKGFILFMGGMLFVRAAFADFYLVPSSSMYPTLRQGDRVIANKLAYDWRLPMTDYVIKKIADPERGDIVTFISPEDQSTRLVKRLIAVPGDTVEMRADHLYINGKPAAYQLVSNLPHDQLNPVREYAGVQQVYQEQWFGLQHGVIVMPERQSLRDFGPVTVPTDSYLMLGDNRDNSRDSRYFGFVKRELITGRVSRTLYSLNPDNYYLPRLDRFGSRL